MQGITGSAYLLMFVVSNGLFPRSLWVQTIFILTTQVDIQFQPAVVPVRLSSLWRRRGPHQPVRRHFTLTLYQDRPSLLVTEDIKILLECIGIRAKLFSRFRNQFLEIHISPVSSYLLQNDVRALGDVYFQRLPG